MPSPTYGRFAAGVSALLTFFALIASPSYAGPAKDRAGVYRGCCSPSAVGSYESWIGRPVYRALDFLPDEDWSKIRTPDWWIAAWKPSPYRSKVVISVPLLVDHDSIGGTTAPPATLEQCATGAYNSHFYALAKKLVAHGFGGNTIRLGWEPNGEWYRWSAIGREVTYAKCFRQVVWTMRIPGSWNKYDFTQASTRPILSAAYPGSDVVDYVGLDAYDNDPWATTKSRLDWAHAFAVARGKAVSVPEWGLGWAGPLPRDDPQFIQDMTSWMDAAPAVAYHNAWEGSASCACGNGFMLGKHPQSAAKFKALYGP